MTSLMIVYDARSIAGQCDSACYGSAEPGCGCICGGMNHGAGRRRAIRNTYKHWGQWLDNAARANPSIAAADVFPGLRP